ncbi:hypothetical protein NIES208_13355 [[Limnothrix rosea] IAM M-220]|nr:hypothetical protein NIES208_13355 [[Limnothrix rosea] IAM M-220]
MGEGCGLGDDGVGAGVAIASDSKFGVTVNGVSVGMSLGTATISMGTKVVSAKSRRITFCKKKKAIAP